MIKTEFVFDRLEAFSVDEIVTTALGPNTACIS